MRVIARVLVKEKSVMKVQSGLYTLTRSLQTCILLCKYVGIFTCKSHVPESLPCKSCSSCLIRSDLVTFFTAGELENVNSEVSCCGIILLSVSMFSLSGSVFG